MFKNPVPLNSSQHSQLRLSQEPNFLHAAGEMFTPVVSGEAWQIAREYIMLFPLADDKLPQALLGIKPGSNEYVSINPPWWGRYVPAHIRRYPFVAAFQGTLDGTGERRFTVMVDSEAPQLNEEHGEPLFVHGGQPSPLLMEVQNVLRNLQYDMERTAQLVGQIAASGVLIEQTIKIERKSGEPIGITGFRIVDTKRLKECSGETLQQLIKSGALDLIYAHICSLTNLRDGLLAKRAAEEVPDIENLFGGRDDAFRFDA